MFSSTMSCVAKVSIQVVMLTTAVQAQVHIMHVNLLRHSSRVSPLTIMRVMRDKYACCIHK